MIKLGEGLDFTLKDFGFKEDATTNMQLHETPSKTLRVIGNKDQLIIRVAFVIKSNNYASNLLGFLLVKKQESPFRIKKCTVCKSSKVIIKNKDGQDDLVIYSGEKDEMQLKDISAKNIDSEDVSITYAPPA